MVVRPRRDMPPSLVCRLFWYHPEPAQPANQGVSWAGMSMPGSNCSHVSTWWLPPRALISRTHCNQFYPQTAAENGGQAKV